jgi:citrate lyase beta subunit
MEMENYNCSRHAWGSYWIPTRCTLYDAAQVEDVQTVDNVVEAMEINEYCTLFLEATYNEGRHQEGVV